MPKTDKEVVEEMELEDEIVLLLKEKDDDTKARVIEGAKEALGLKGSS